MLLQWQRRTEQDRAGANDQRSKKGGRGTQSVSYSPTLNKSAYERHQTGRDMSKCLGIDNIS